MRFYSLLKHFNELRVHVFEFVRNIEADDALVFERRPELGRELGAVTLFHDKDDVCPIEKFRRDRRIGIVTDTGRRGFNAGTRREYLLSGWASQKVLAADEEDVHHRQGYGTREGLAI